MFGGTGEPLVHKRISDICVGAYQANLDYAFTTNGVLIVDGKGLPKPGLLNATWIKLSVNAGDRETYAKVHQTKATDWDHLWRGLGATVLMRDAIQSKTTIGVQCVVLPENVYTLAALAEECHKVGVDYLVLKPYTQATFMTSHRYDGMDYAKMREELHRVAALKLGKLKIIHRVNAIAEEITKKHAYDKCRATPMFWIYSMGNGDVFSCSAHLMDERFKIGNLYKNSFQEIWEGDKRRENWELMRTFDIKQCRLNCRQNNQNKYLHQLLHQPHINFP
jgi:radical SAM protein with 4Fe4S-binding SPASM domain